LKIAEYRRRKLLKESRTKGERRRRDREGEILAATEVLVAREREKR
jgi:hypothetical protein